MIKGKNPPTVTVESFCQLGEGVVHLGELGAVFFNARLGDQVESLKYNIALLLID